MEEIKELVDILVEIEGMGFSPNSEEEERYKEGVQLLLEEVQKLNGKDSHRSGIISVIGI